jgi:hypothetical protein
VRGQCHICDDLVDDLVFSRIDLTSPTWMSDFPIASELPFCECILGPGDCLFLPKWYWHFVQAVDLETTKEWRLINGLGIDDNEFIDRPSDFSFSISFWWGKRCDPPSL